MRPAGSGMPTGALSGEWQRGKRPAPVKIEVTGAVAFNGIGHAGRNAWAGR